MRAPFCYSFASRSFPLIDPLSLIRRFVKLFVWTTISTTLGHYYYPVVDEFIGRLTASSPRLKPVGLLFVDQFLYDPFFLWPLYFLVMICIDAKPLSALPDTLRCEWADSVKTAWPIWFPGQAINFWLIPLQYRILFVNAVALLWTVVFELAGPTPLLCLCHVCVV